MKEKVYVLVKAETHFIKHVVERISTMSGVTECSVVTGAYDLIVVVEGEYITDLLTTVVKGIRGIEGVTDTETLVKVKF